MVGRLRADLQPKYVCGAFAAWSPKPCAHIQVNVTEKGIDVIDIFGMRRRVTYDPVRTKSLPIPLGESPIYIVGPKGLKAAPRPDPGW